MGQELPLRSWGFDGAIMKRVSSQIDSVIDESVDPKGKVVGSIREEPLPLQDELYNTTSRSWREKLGIVALKEIVFVSGVGGRVVFLLLPWEEVWIWVKRPLDSLQPAPEAPLH